MSDENAQRTETVARATLDLASDYRAPARALERRLAALWSARLMVDQVGVDDDFFELGGHSLLAAELLSEVEREIGMAVPATALYLQPTVAELAEAIDQLRAAAGVAGETP